MSGPDREGSESDRRPRRGRKPKAAPVSATGLGGIINARIKWETRRAIEDEASRLGISISHVADEWLTQAASGRASLDALLGGAPVAHILLLMVDAASAIRDEFGDIEESDEARYALVRAWGYIMGRGLPLRREPAETRTVVSTRLAARKALSDLSALIQSAVQRAALLRTMPVEERDVLGRQFQALLGGVLGEAEASRLTSADDRAIDQLADDLDAALRGGPQEDDQLWKLQVALKQIFPRLASDAMKASAEAIDAIEQYRIAKKSGRDRMLRAMEFGEAVGGRYTADLAQEVKDRNLNEATRRVLRRELL